jgi:Zn-dependent protease with chaperone function
MIRTFRRGLPTLLLAYLLLFGPALISAPTALTMSARAEVQAPAYDEATLEKFAIAAREIVNVRKEYEPLIRTAPNAEIAQALSEDARARMDAAFSTAGITPEQYLEIAQAAQTDTALRERIGEMLEE